MPNDAADLSLILSVEDNALAAYLAGRVSFVRRKLLNLHVARALHWAPRAVREKVLNALHPLRRERVMHRLQGFGAGIEPPTLDDVTKARRMLLEPLESLIKGTALVWTDEAQPRVMEPEETPVPAHLERALPQELDPERATLDEMLAGCVRLAEHYRRYRGDELAAMRERATHPLICELLDLALAVEPDYRHAARRAIDAFAARRAAWLDLARTGIVALTRREAPQATATRLAAQIAVKGVTAETLLAAAPDAPLPTLDSAVEALAAALVGWKTAAYRNSVVTLDAELDRQEEDYLRFGLELAVGCTYLPTKERQTLLLRRKRAMLTRLRTNAAMFVEFCVSLGEGESPHITEKRLASFLADDPDSW